MSYVDSHLLVAAKTTKESSWIFSAWDCSLKETAFAHLDELHDPAVPGGESQPSLEDHWVRSRQIVRNHEW